MSQISFKTSNGEFLAVPGHMEKSREITIGSWMLEFVFDEFIEDWRSGKYEPVGFLSQLTEEGAMQLYSVEERLAGEWALPAKECLGFRIENCGGNIYDKEWLILKVKTPSSKG